MNNYNIIRIHTPAVAHPSNAIEVSTLSTIPKFLREAITLENHQLWLDNIEGCKCAAMGSIICYEKSDQTASGYNCWSVGQANIDLIKSDDGVFCTKSRIIHAMLIPTKDEAKPVWVNSCPLTYNGDGTVTLVTDKGSVSGRIGIDFVLCHGWHDSKENGKPKASILSRYDEDYNDYIVCDESDKDIGKLCELYPA